MARFEGRETGKTLGSLIEVADDITAAVNKFRTDNDLSEDMFANPDHIAIKAADARGYRQMMGWAQDYSSRQTEIEMNGRRLGTSELDRPISLGVRALRWLEIMEPRPSKIGRDKVGVDHVEYYVPRLSFVERVLAERAIVFERERNPSHDWLSIEFPDGLEIKFTNKTLADMTAYEIRKKQARVVWSRNT